MGHGICATHESHKLTCAGFDALRARAGDRCEICGAGGDLNIDHDHRVFCVYAVRGLLCGKCNAFMRYADEGSKRSERADRYEQLAWYRGQVHFLSPCIVGLDSRRMAMEEAQCLGIDLAPTRPGDLPLSAGRQMWVGSFAQVCEQEQLTVPDRLRFYYYLRRRGRYSLNAVPASSLPVALRRWRHRDDGVRLLASKVSCAYCGARNSACVAGRAKVPMQTFHLVRRRRRRLPGSCVPCPQSLPSCRSRRRGRRCG